MIQANELRIGNWVLINGSPNIIRGGGIAAIESGYFNQPIHPIPLTPEILEKAGFEDILNDQIWSKDDIELFHGSRFREERAGYWACAYWQPTESETKTRILYVHQLQNLYFTLTGDELNIKL